MCKITACVIVKNEECNLPCWLESVKQLTEDLVVVDTGSTDKTIEMAQAAGAVVHKFTWQNDFALAKNYALSQVSGDWVIFMDADEYLSSEGCRLVKQTIAMYEKEPDVIGFVTTLINIDKDKQGAYRNAGVQIRIFRNLPHLRYTGAVHERLQYQGSGNKRMQYVPEIKIFHTGYSSSIVRQKAARNLEIIQKRIKDIGEQPEDAAYLADCYYTLQDYPQCVFWAKQAVQKNIQLGGRERRLWGIFLQSMNLTGESLLVLEKWTIMAEQRFPQVPDFRFLLGFAGWQRQDYIQAERQMRSGLELYAATADTELMGVNETIAMLPQVYGYMGQLALWKKNRIESLAWTEKSLAADRYRAQTAGLYMQLLAELPDIDFIACLHKFYDKKADAAFLLPLLTKIQRPQVRLYYMRQAGQVPSDAIAYMLTGKLAPAAAALTEEMAGLYGLGMHLLKHQAEKTAELPVLMPIHYRQAEQGAEGKYARQIRQKLQRMEAE